MTALAQTEIKPGHAQSGGWTAATTLAGWCILCMGAVFRLGRFAHWRSLWLDELYLSRSILTRGYHDLLFQPLHYQQAAPVGFLLMARAAVSIFGPGERALRLTSFIFGIASLPLFFGVVRRCLPPRAGLIALAMFAVLGPLVYYSNELKQYSSDVAVNLAIALAIMRWLEAPSARRLAMAAAMGAIGLFFSHPAMFVLAGIGVTVLIIRLRERREIAALLGVGAVWVTAFVVNYIWFLRPLAHSEAHARLVQYWVDRDAFMPLKPWRAVPWIFNRLWFICQDPGAMWISYPSAVMAGILIGIAALWRRKNAMILLAPLPVALLASAARQYPFGDRLVLYLVPALLILLAAGIEMLWAFTPRGMGGIILLVMALGPSLTRATGYLFDPPGREETLQAYQWVARHWQPGDTLYLSCYAEVSYEHYEPQAGFAALPPPGQVLVQPRHEDDPTGLIDLKRLAGRGRVWLVFVHTLNGNGEDEEKTALMGMNEIGMQMPQDTHPEPGAEVYLYDCPAKSVSRQ